MKIAVIDNFDSFVYNLIRYLREIPDVELIIQRNNVVDFKLIEDCDAILLSPGPGIPSEAGSLMEVIDRFHQTKSILGICLGHQAIGEYFGGELVLSKHPLHGKSSTISIVGNSKLFEHLPNSITVGRYHSWLVSSTIPDELEITCSSENNEVMGIKHRTFNVEGIQFHPESILTPNGRKMIQNWVKIIQNNTK